MGLSSSGILLYGIPFGEEDVVWQEDEQFEEVEELGEFLALKAGHKNPWEDEPPGYSYINGEDFPEFEERTDEWYALTRRLEDEAPVELIVAGYYEYAMYFLAL